jgi:hypothetical protein
MSTKSLVVFAGASLGFVAVLLLAAWYVVEILD